LVALLEDAKKTLGIMLFSGPYGSQDADHMCRLAEKALEKGYGVNIFLYGEGVHAQLKGQDPELFMNIGARLQKLRERGAVIKSCMRCSKARGYVEGEFDEAEDRYPSSKALNEVQIYSLYGFVDMLKSCDKIITFGGSR
jgi:tRNA 2-thiouridine synthesizing protein D